MKFLTMDKAERDRFLLCVFILVCAIGLTFWSVRSFLFVGWDDPLLIHDNWRVQGGNISELAWFWRHPYASLYMPMTYTAWGVLAAVAQQPNAAGGTGLDASVFHSFNLLVHLGSAILVFCLLRQVLRQLGRSSYVADIAAVAGALTFGLHPMQVESVVWATELKGLLATFFALGALNQYLAALPGNADKVLQHNEQSNDIVKRMTVGTVFFLAALLSKPSVVILPLLAVILDVAIYNRSLLAALKRASGWFVLALVFALIARSLQSGDDMKFVTPLWARPLVASDALSFYAEKWLWPADLTVNYGRNPRWVMAQPWFLWTWIAPAGVLVLVLWQWRRGRRWPLAAVGISAAAALPNLGLLPFIFQFFSTVSDRYFYLAMLGPALLVSVLASVAMPALLRHNKPSHRSFQRPLAVTLCACVPLLLAMWGIRSSQQAHVWRDATTLVAHALQVNPLDSESMAALGSITITNGDAAEGRRLLQKAVQLDSANLSALYNLGAMEVEAKRPEMALDYFNRVVAIDPSYKRVYVGASVALMNLQRHDEAVAAAGEALKLDPSSFEAQYQLALAQHNANRDADAQVAAERAVQMNPNSLEAHKLLGIVYLSRKKFDEAIQQYQILVQMQPNEPMMRYGLAQVLLKAERYAAAAEILQQLQLLAPRDLKIKRDLARARGP